MTFIMAAHCETVIRELKETKGESCMDTIIENWDQILEQTCKEHDISSVSFDTWLRPLQPYKMKGDTIYIIVTNNNIMAIDYLNKKYRLPLQVSIGEFIGKNCEIVFIRPDDVEKEEKEEVSEPENDFNYSSSMYTFENFVVSDNNRFAYSAALAVAESPGEVYNPLFIYSGVGLGKTHLMHSIAHYINKINPEKNVLYVTSETFTNELIEAIRNSNNNLIQFREKYRNIDVLLIDDIQFIINKDRTQEEFFHTFNHLHMLKKQIVISSDKPPKDFKTLEERLKTRFEMGLIADISSPDYETRMAILEKNIEKKGYNISKDILEYIAINVKSNIRELNGALNKLIAFTQLENTKELTLAIAEQELKDIISPDSPKVITPESIIQLVCSTYDVSYDEMNSKKRNSYINTPRQVAMYLCRQYTDISYEELGNILNRDHTTIMHGEENIKKNLDKDSELKEKVDLLKKLINP